MMKLLAALLVYASAGCTPHHAELGWARFGTNEISFENHDSGPARGTAVTLRDDFSNALEVAFSPPSLRTNESEFPFSNDSVLIKFSYSAQLPEGPVSVFFPIADERHVKIAEAWRGDAGTDLYVLFQTSHLGSESIRAAISSPLGLRGVATFDQSQAIELICRDEQPYFKCLSVWITTYNSSKAHINFRNLTERSIQIESLRWPGGELNINKVIKPGQSLAIRGDAILPIDEVSADPTSLSLTKRVLTFIPSQFVQQSTLLFEGKHR